jgi:hypothetical protein
MPNGSSIPENRSVADTFVVMIKSTDMLLPSFSRLYSATTFYKIVIDVHLISFAVASGACSQLQEVLYKFPFVNFRGRNFASSD